MYEGAGNKNASLVVVFARAESKVKFFPQGKYLSELCRSLHVDEKDVYVTPLLKGEKPLHENVEGLINELALVKPKVVWILGQEPLSILYGKDSIHHYQYTYSMYMPFLLHNFFALLVPGEKEVASMPEDIRRIFYKRMQYAASELSESGEILTPPKERRGDWEMLQKMEADTPMHRDDALEGTFSYTTIWSDKVRDYVILVGSEEAKVHAKKLGFGLVVSKKEVGDLEKDAADFLTQSMKAFRVREVTRK